MSATHCWHRSGGNDTPGATPQLLEPCCWCGKTKSIPAFSVYGHGIYVQPWLVALPEWTSVDEYDRPPEPCPGRPAPPVLSHWDIDIPCPRCGRAISVHVEEVHVSQYGRTLNHSYTPVCCMGDLTPEQQNEIAHLVLLNTPAKVAR